VYQRDRDEATRGGWLEPRPDEPSLQRYLRTLRERRAIVALAVVAAVGIAALYVESVAPVYEAEADLLVSAVNDPNLSGAGLITSSGDPNREVQTVARLVTTRGVAERARGALDTSRSTRDLLAHVQAAPVAGSDIVAVTARGSTPLEAAALAEAFAAGVVQDRSARMNAGLERAVPRLQALVDRVPAGAAGVSSALAGRLAALKALEGGDDPTVQLEGRSDPPAAPVAPRKALSVFAGGIVGLLLGVAAAFAADALDPRLRRESQLQEMFDLPILARIPSVRGRRHAPLAPAPERRRLLTAYRALDHALDALDREGEAGAHSIVFTGPGRGDGCTTTALHHGWLLAAEGEPVIAIDGDLRHPALAAACGVSASPHGAEALNGLRPIDDAVVTAVPGGVPLRVFAPGERYADGFLGERILLVLGNRLIARARTYHERIVVDAPALAEGIHALPLARAADRLVLVTRLGSTRLAALRELGEVLARHDVRPDGIVVIGARPHQLPEPPVVESARVAAPAPLEATAERRTPWRRAARTRPTALIVATAGMVVAAAALGLLAGVRPGLALAATAALGFAAMAALDVRRGLCLFVVLSFLEVLPSPGAAASAMKAAGFLVAASWLAWALTGRGGGREALPAAGLWLLGAFVVWAAASVAWAQSSPEALSAVSRYGLNAVLFLIVCSVIRTRRELEWIVVAFVAGAALSAAYGLLVAPPTAGGPGIERVAGTIGDANAFAAVLVAALPLALALAADGARRASVRRLGLAAAALAAAGIVLSLSRGGLLALATALVAGVLVSGRWRAVALAAAVVIALAGVSYLVLVAPVAARERVTESGGGTGRSDIWRVGWRMVEARPLLGVGAGNYATTSVQYLLRPGRLARSDLIAGTPKVAHNTYLHVLAELGVIGALAFLGLVAFALGCGVRAARAAERLRDRRLELLSRAWLVSAAGLLAADFFVSAEFSKQLWLLLALGPCLLAVARSPAEG
jgi:O-antigen ligase/capsular polysaccharide biosynthesis protein